MDGCTQNWPEVEERLKELEVSLSKPSLASGSLLPRIVAYYRERFDKGERTRELAEAIMAFDL